MNEFKVGDSVRFYYAFEDFPGEPDINILDPGSMQQNGVHTTSLRSGYVSAIDNDILTVHIKASHCEQFVKIHYKRCWKHQ